MGAGKNVFDALAVDDITINGDSLATDQIITEIKGVDNGTGTVTISNVAPSGVGTPTINSWFHIRVGENAGNGLNLYLPMWD